ncbi:hypothetical protein [Jeotgalibaca arthritidis]|uniref:hypothetical protein n=1 Tax=Jeotgalibaca arthritidis TaxID=1868794 RepID=UPI00359FFA5E
MENYYDAHSLNIAKSSYPQSHLSLATNPELSHAVMPLYQIIRFANQAAGLKKKVSITIERKLGHAQYERLELIGTFGSSVNTNKQITFKADQGMVYILKIDQILAIQQL